MMLLLAMAVAAQAMVLPSDFPPDIACENYQNGSTVAMSECLYGQSQIWDQWLNVEYRAALARAEVEPRKLREAQRAWLKYRDANCGVYRTVKGSIAIILADRCWRDMTRDRTLELREMDWSG
ncbi:lysozyme inhibitor LprI family protein [Sphingobium aquiterrae]|uniref:lysozyme inhibitor LprI family protein n=1 Tax=Sphingobium aquiterrae TaxID=2038656 RepID=UPI003017CFAF